MNAFEMKPKKRAQAVLWPEFSRTDFDEALKFYEGVQINKGKW